MQKIKLEELFKELLALAETQGLQVRKEKLLREVGYHARSGSCRLREQNLVILDRDAPLRDQVEFLATELSERVSSEAIPPELQKFLKAAPSTG